jgi:hypothetical protein
VHQIWLIGSKGKLLTSEDDPGLLDFTGETLRCSIRALVVDTETGQKLDAEGVLEATLST